MFSIIFYFILFIRNIELNIELDTFRLEGIAWTKFAIKQLNGNFEIM